MGVDVGDPAVLRNRSWRWLRARILGLVTKPRPGFLEDGTPLPANRLQAELDDRTTAATPIAASAAREG